MEMKGKKKDEEGHEENGKEKGGERESEEVEKSEKETLIMNTFIPFFPRELLFSLPNCFRSTTSPGKPSNSNRISFSIFQEYFVHKC